MSPLTLHDSTPNSGRRSWLRHWGQVIPFFAFPDGVRRIIYTTNAIEALNSSCAVRFEPAVTSPGTMPR
jgi:transposase-like protein